MLAHLSFLATLTLAAGAPLVPRDFLVQWIPNSLRSLSREMFIFLHPFYSPTTRQTVTSCLLVIFTSILVGFGMSHSKGTTNKWDAHKSWLMRLTYGLLAPDYVAMSAGRQQLLASAVANSYNREFPPEDPTHKWSLAHGKFVLEGGFVLWEDNKPTAVLKPEVLFYMIKAGQVDAPTVSKKDLLAKTNYSNALTFWFAGALITWYGFKFSLRGFPFFALVISYAWSAWHSYSMRNGGMRSIRQTIPIYRKPREKCGEKEQQEAHETKGMDGKEAEISDEFDVELQSVHPSLIKLENSLSQMIGIRCEDISTQWRDVSGGGYWSLIKFYITIGFIHFPVIAITTSAYVICQLLHIILSILINIFGACTIPMRIQWKLICSEHTPDNLDKVSVGRGRVDIFATWGTVLLNSWSAKFTSRTEQCIWRSSAIFLLVQPLILWFSAPHQRWIKKLTIGKTMKNIIFCLWCLACFAARVAIFAIAFWSLKEALAYPDSVCNWVDGRRWCWSGWRLAQ